jgi:hypothetical protein
VSSSIEEELNSLDVSLTTSLNKRCGTQTVGYIDVEFLVVSEKLGKILHVAFAG